MTIFSTILLIFAGIFYGVAFCFVCGTLRFADLAKYARASAWLGFMAQTLVVVTYILQTSRAPFSNPYILLVALSWVFVLVQMLSVYTFKTRAILVFAMPVAFVLSLLPLGCPVFAEGFSRVSSASFVAQLHAGVAVVSYGFTGLAAVFGALYLRQKRNLLSKRSSVFSLDAPSLGRIFSLVRFSLSAAALMMFFAIALGVLVLPNAQVSFGEALKFALGGLLFATQLLLCALTFAKKIADSRVCFASVILSIFALIILIPMQLKNYL